MILAASGVEPETNGKEPSVMPFHYAAVAACYNPFGNSQARKRGFQGNPQAVFSVTNSVKQIRYASETTTLTVFSDFAVDFPSVFVTATLYSEVPAAAVLGL